MGIYQDYREKYPLFSFLSLFLSIAFLMFLFFCFQVLRPWSMMYDRMENTEVTWEEIRKKVETVNFGENPEQVVSKMGEPDIINQSGDIKVYSYQKYGMYKPTFFYDVVFREDTLYKIAIPVEQN